MTDGRGNGRIFAQSSNSSAVSTRLHRLRVRVCARQFAARRGRNGQFYPEERIAGGSRGVAARLSEPSRRKRDISTARPSSSPSASDLSQFRESTANVLSIRLSSAPSHTPLVSNTSRRRLRVVLSESTDPPLAGSAGPSRSSDRSTSGPSVARAGATSPRICESRTQPRPTKTRRLTPNM